MKSLVTIEIQFMNFETSRVQRRKPIIIIIIIIITFYNIEIIKYKPSARLHQKEVGYENNCCGGCSLWVYMKSKLICMSANQPLIVLKLQNSRCLIFIVIYIYFLKTLTDGPVSLQGGGAPMNPVTRGGAVKTPGAAAGGGGGERDGGRDGGRASSSASSSSSWVFFGT